MESGSTRACGAARRAILHVHPTRHCNLACGHCYSSSGPAERAMLSASLLSAALEDAADAGYAVVSWSGGEPLLYPSPPGLLRRGRDLGLSNSVVTNGYLVGKRAFEDAATYVDVLVLSVDGPPPLQNSIHGRPDAFDVLKAAIKHLKAAGLEFGLVHTVTKASWDSLDWLYSFAHDRGARLLQLHSLEQAGRAAVPSPQPLTPLSDDDLVSLYLLGPLLEATCTESTPIHVDLTHVDLLREHPAIYFSAAAPGSPSAVYTPLVVEEDGTVSPYVYGLDRRFSLGTLGSRRLSALLDVSGRNARAARVIENLCFRVRAALIEDSESRPVFNWYEELCRTSHLDDEAPAGAAERGHDQGLQKRAQDLPAS